MHKQKNSSDLLAPMPLSFYRLGQGVTPPPVYDQQQLLHLPRALINADQLVQLGGGIKPMATIRLADRPSTSLLMYTLLFRTCN
ncbi:MAG: hypothetical protein EOO39_14195 [Cytophagaceae bacterium]|nr:MAG: hypothetical protein EOO39_14195 [Cytophagaceae bacterium]